MNQLIEYNAGDGKKISFEITAPEQQPTRRGGNSNVKKVSSDILASMDGSLEDALQSINTFGEALLDNLKKIAPSKAEVEFSVKMTAKGNLIIASGEAEANFSIKLTWEKS